MVKTKISVIGIGTVGYPLYKTLQYYHNEVYCSDMTKKCDSWDKIVDTDIVFVCVLPNTTIRLENKIKEIKDIEIGDEVLTHNGNFKKVMEIKKREYNGDILNIKSVGSSNLFITPEHLIFSIQDLRNEKRLNKINYRKNRIKYLQGKNPDWYPVKELCVGDILVFPKSTRKINQHSLDINEDLYKVLGFYISEGNISDFKYIKNENRNIGILLTFHEKEDKYIDDIKKICLNENLNISIYHYKNHHVKQVYIPKIGKKFFELCDSGCSKKHLPFNYRNLTEKALINLLQGIWFGDGNFHKDRYTLSTTSKTLAYQIKDVLMMFDVYSSIYIQYHKNKKTSYQVRVGGKQKQILSNLLKINHLKREGKKTSYQYSWQDKKYFYFPIKKIIKTHYNGLVYNLEVEDDNSYVAEDIIVHNCVPTNPKSNGRLDMSAVENNLSVLKEFKYKGIVVIKSTLGLGYINDAIKRYPFKIIVFPEWLYAVNAFPDTVKPEMTVIGIDILKTIIIGPSEFTLNKKDLIANSKELKLLFDACKWHKYEESFIVEPEEAVMIKLTANALASTKISFANQIQLICEEYHINADSIMNVIKQDPRCSPRYLTPGRPYAGHCLPKDTDELINSISDTYLFDGMKKVNQIFIKRSDSGKTCES